MLTCFLRMTEYCSYRSPLFVKLSLSYKTFHCQKQSVTLEPINLKTMILKHLLQFFKIKNEFYTARIVFSLIEDCILNDPTMNCNIPSSVFDGKDLSFYHQSPAFELLNSFDRGTEANVWPPSWSISLKIIVVREWKWIRKHCTCKQVQV